MGSVFFYAKIKVEWRIDNYNYREGGNYMHTTSSNSIKSVHYLFEKGKNPKKYLENKMTGMMINNK